MSSCFWRSSSECCCFRLFSRSMALLRSVAADVLRSAISLSLSLNFSAVAWRSSSSAICRSLSFRSIMALSRSISTLLAAIFLSNSASFSRDNDSRRSLALLSSESRFTRSISFSLSLREKLFSISLALAWNSIDMRCRMSSVRRQTSSSKAALRTWLASDSNRSSSTLNTCWQLGHFSSFIIGYLY